MVVPPRMTSSPTSWSMGRLASTSDPKISKMQSSAECTGWSFKPIIHRATIASCWITADARAAKSHNAPIVLTNGELLPQQTADYLASRFGADASFSGTSLTGIGVPCDRFADFWVVLFGGFSRTISCVEEPFADGCPPLEEITQFSFVRTGGVEPVTTLWERHSGTVSGGSAQTRGAEQSYDLSNRTIPLSADHTFNVDGGSVTLGQFTFEFGPEDFIEVRWPDGEEPSADGPVEHRLTNGPLEGTVGNVDLAQESFDVIDPATGDVLRSVSFTGAFALDIARNFFAQEGAEEPSFLDSVNEGATSAGSSCTRWDAGGRRLPHRRCAAGPGGPDGRPAST